MVEEIPEGPPLDTDPPEVEDDLESLTWEQVEQRRRSAAAELERRQSVAEGQERVGQAAYDYLIAARKDCEHTPTELGQIIIDHITTDPEQEEGT